MEVAGASWDWRSCPLLVEYLESALDENWVIPPQRFAIVEKGIYRSGYPNQQSEQFLEKLGLRSIVYLCKEPVRDWNRDFIRRNGIQLFHLGSDGNKEPFLTVPLELIQESLSRLLDTRNHPILIHCNKGTHRTGCLVGCLRRVQRWSLTSILGEYQRFAGGRPRLIDQQSIELFDPRGIDYDPQFAPSWLQT
ncbi:diphosphoinositol-polyphosphate diphosphatase [Plasmodiophora brassicae]|uniref:diphosphoinositol-polyphosphate diphosphatase n=1 Tax=Plasmodiophora brassicae TaxID=37360 RepID=A0A3P3YJ24_PLABS|nr:unnamed protein product [Plasmodiophora brassicae]